MKNPYNLSIEALQEKSKIIRQHIITMNAHAGAGHTGADLSETDILATLYFSQLHYQQGDITNPDRDRFILSKGHGAGGYYCTLSEAGFFDQELLKTYLQKDSLLPGHPVRQKTPGVELNTGALGHGFPVAVGLALGAKKQHKPYTTYLLLGDGELEEGSNWEAAMSAAHFKLDNLIAILDRNTLQLADRTESIMALEPLADKFRAFGFDVQEIDGHNHQELIDAIAKAKETKGAPHLILAHTTKGKGVSFIEDQPAWHHKIPVGDEIASAIQELE